MAKQQYIRCPRCELNYILKDEKMCSVCKKQLQVGGGEVDELELELCPICKTNYIQADEIMCASCLEEKNIDPETLNKNPEDWQKYINRDEDDDFDSAEEEVGDMTIKEDLDDEDDMMDTGLDDEDMVFHSGEGFEEEAEEIEEEYEDELDEDFDDDFDDYDDDDYDDDEEDEDDEDDEF